MSNNFIRIAIYVMSWCSWAIRNLIFFPAAILTLIIVFLIVRDHSSPGQVLVNIIQSADQVTDGVNWTWRECPSISSNSNVFPPKPAARPSVLAEDCPKVVSDARGYAEHIDNSFMGLIVTLWGIMAAISATVELSMHRFPVLKHRTRLKMRTITTREQLLVNEKVRERIATHIVTGAHGYETLCTSGFNVSYNDKRVLIENCEKLADNALPVTCRTCFNIWNDVHSFQSSDFDMKSGKGSFVETDLTEITIPTAH
ncbi:hypothetical protein KG201_003180 [Salmonella enterica subsp. enterica serovar Ibadan]|nr:hypothetical protein [Salmonella enterica subsp. enterica serovar Ibadan]